MSYPSFNVGEVLTAADMNAVGLWLVKTQTIGTSVSSVQVTSAFSANYDNYLIILAGGSGTQAGLRMTLGATTTGYYSHTVYNVYTTNTVLGFGPGNSNNWGNAGYSTSNGLDARATSGVKDILNPRTIAC